jgi:chromosome segregation ATPase
MRHWIKFIFIFFLASSGVAYAIEPVTNSMTQGLGQGLSDLKNSVDQLAAGNQGLALKNAELKSKLNESQMVLQKLAQENQSLTNAKQKLEEPNSVRARQIEQLESESKDLDHKINGLNDQITKAQDTLAADEKEEQEVNDHITQMLDHPPVVDPSSLPQELRDLQEQNQKERLADLKLISQAQEHCQLLQAQILDFQKGFPVPSQPSKEKLQNEIQQVQAEITQLTSVQKNPEGGDWTQEELQRLQESITDLEKKQDELKGLVAQMQKKTENMHYTADQKDETAKLQANIEKLKTETKNLKFDLESMQQQMVELDKRKAYLETILK